jgi:hypothetical protein
MGGGSIPRVCISVSLVDVGQDPETERGQLDKFIFVGFLWKLLQE